MKQLPKLLNQALAHTRVLADGGTDLSVDEWRTVMASSYWGANSQRQVTSALVSTLDEWVEGVASYLRRKLARFIDLETDRIGHSFEVIGELTGTISGREYLLEHHAVSKVTGFARSLIHAAAILGSDCASNVIARWSQGEPLRFKTCVLLGGGIRVGEPLTLRSGLRIYSLPLSSDLLPTSVPCTGTLPAEQLLGQVVMEIDATTYPALFHPGKDDHSHAQLVTGTSMVDVTLDAFFLAISLVCNRRIGMAWYWMDYRESGAFKSQASSLLMGPGPVGAETLMNSMTHNSQSNITQLTAKTRREPELNASRLWRSVEVARGLQLRMDSDTRFRIAVTRWSRAALPKITSADRFIDLRIALEALYVDSDSGELAFRLATTAGRHLGSTIEERRSISKTIKDFYGVASRVIHGTDVVDVRAADADLIDSAGKLCRDGILKAIDNPNCAVPGDLLLN